MQEVQENNFSQMVDFKTHIKGGCLDLVITNMPEKVSNVSEAGRLGKSDHVIIQFDLEISSRGWRREKVGEKLEESGLGEDQKRPGGDSVADNGGQSNS